MANTNDQEHKDWLKQRIQDDIDNWEQHIEDAKSNPDTPDTYFEAELAIARRALRWVSMGHKPTEIEESYIKILKTLRETRTVIEELKDMQNSSQSG